MELRYPFLLIIVGIVLIINFILFKKKKVNFENGSKIANTSYLRNTDYFKKRLHKYNMFVKILIFCCYFSILICSILICRMAIVKVVNKEAYNRDIFLCMDISGSVNNLNEQVVDNLVSTVNSLQGERFGVSIFNTSSVTLSPLTDDYNYVTNILKTIKKSIDFDYKSDDSKFSDFMTYASYLTRGTLEGNEVRGSSLIGDGLATCVYNFNNLEKERSRIIIFTTDNDLAGTPMVELLDAARIAKKYNIKVFGIGTQNISKKNKDEFKKAVEITGGKFYENSTESVSSIISDIEKTSKSLLKDNIEIKRTDIPEIPFIILFITILILIITSKKVVK